MLQRYSYWLLSLLTIPFLLVPSQVVGQSNDARIAIVDTAHLTTNFLDKLKERNVLVIGRYLSRCGQKNLPFKRIAYNYDDGENRPEIEEILERGFGVFSIYQYHNNSGAKFNGFEKNGKTPLPDQDCKPAKTGRSPKSEAWLDATAALDQAKSIGQPEGSAIYFGVDFDFWNDSRYSEVKVDMIEYFGEVKRVLGGKYKLGAYGSGDALDVLLGERLIDYAWLSSSASFGGTTKFYNSTKWHMFQANTDVTWLSDMEDGSCTHGLRLDTNVQNSRFAGQDLGFWWKPDAEKIAVKFVIGEARTKAVLNQRRFVCDGTANIRKTAESKSDDLIATSICQGHKGLEPQKKVAPYLAFVRLDVKAQNNLVEIDFDNDGHLDGWTWLPNLTTTASQRPNYIFNYMLSREKIEMPDVTCEVAWKMKL